MPRLIDSHAHLDFSAFDVDREDVIHRARAAGVGKIVSVATNLLSARRNLDLAAAHPGVLFATAGVHPHEAEAFDDGDWPAVEELLEDPRVVAVGEAGLDYYYEFSPHARQREVFARQLAAGASRGLPTVIHVRDAFEDAFALLEGADLSSGGVLHCFTGDAAACELSLSIGIYISLYGIVTFPKAGSIREVARVVPGDRLLVETDAPYLSPPPRRGGRNEPAFVARTARALAEARDEPFEELCARASDNAERLFGI